MLIAHLPPESAIAQLRPDYSPWRLEHHLLDDVRMAVQASIPRERPEKIKPHPSRMTGSVTRLDPARRRKIRAGQARAAERRRQIEAGEIA